MDAKKKNITVKFKSNNRLVDLKWLHGASRYNNGATLHKKKYLLRVVIGRAKQIIQKKLPSNVSPTGIEKIKM